MLGRRTELMFVTEIHDGEMCFSGDELLEGKKGGGNPEYII